MKVCAVIPAAGRGSRLQASLPKLLLPLSENLTVWSVLRQKLLPLVDHIHLIVSPSFVSIFRERLESDMESGFVSLSLQAEPIGMGDAIFCGYDVWSEAETVLVVWGDQVNVSAGTLSKALQVQAKAQKTLTLPLTKMSTPYVEYVLEQERLIAVKQSREGDLCSPNSLSDVGTFVFSVDSIKEVWGDYLANIDIGQETGEVNFLPFLVFLSEINWNLNTFIVPNALEARGINTPEDLQFFTNQFAAGVL